MKTIALPAHGILIQINDDGGSIESDLLDVEVDGSTEFEDVAEYKAATDGILSTILAHAIAGVDVEDPAYVEGIENAVENISNDYL